jgi:hypothetical protein
MRMFFVMAVAVLPTIAGILVLAQAAPGAPPSACLGLETVRPGTSWTYSGWRQWTAEGSGQPDSGAVRWTTTVLATRLVPTGRLLLVRGFVSELAWSVPTTAPRLSILACLKDRLLRLAFLADSAARVRFEHWTDADAGRGEVLLQPPLADGAIFGQDPPRQDDMYGWAVERLKPAPAVPRSCGQPGPDAFRLTMRTLPDHQIMEWRAGLGVTSYTYAHHGTPAAAEVQLVRCTRG